MSQPVCLKYEKHAYLFYIYKKTHFDCYLPKDILWQYKISGKIHQCKISVKKRTIIFLNEYSINNRIGKTNYEWAYDVPQFYSTLIDWSVVGGGGVMGQLEM